MVVNSKQAQMFVPWTRKARNRTNTWSTKADAFHTQINVKKGPSKVEQNLATNMFVTPA